jgi:hypothetical protein
MTSLDLFRTLGLAQITRMSFKEISRNLIWKAKAAAVGRFVVVGQKLFCCLDIYEGSSHRTLEAKRKPSKAASVGGLFHFKYSARGQSARSWRALHITLAYFQSASGAVRV